MESIYETLKKKKFEINIKPRRKGNPFYGIALDLQRKLDLPLSICFQLFKKHTLKELSILVSWWGDYPFKRKNNIGLLYWKLKELYPGKYTPKSGS